MIIDVYFNAEDIPVPLLVKKELPKNNWDDEDAEDDVKENWDDDDPAPVCLKNSLLFFWCNSDVISVLNMSSDLKNILRSVVSFYT